MTKKQMNPPQKQVHKLRPDLSNLFVEIYTAGHKQSKKLNFKCTELLVVTLVTMSVIFSSDA